MQKCLTDGKECGNIEYMGNKKANKTTETAYQTKGSEAYELKEGTVNYQYPSGGTVFQSKLMQGISYKNSPTNSAPIKNLTEMKRLHGVESNLAGELVDQINNPDVIQLCEIYGLKREELGRLTGFSLRALAEWASGKLPSQPAMRRLREIRRLLDALAEIVQISAIPDWLHKPNTAFDRLTPLQVIEVGEIDRLWQMVHSLGSGEAT